MAPLNEDQLKDIRDERKKQIMIAALKVFAENGVKLTKIGMIAKEAGVSHGLVYHYFSSKEEVLFESLEWGMEVADTKKKLDELGKTILSPLDKLKSFVTFGLKEGNSDIFRIIQHLGKSDKLPEHIQDLVLNSGEIYIESLLPWIIEGQKNGEIIQGDSREILEIFLNVISGIMADDLIFWNHNIDRKVDILLRMLSTR
ncbi:TetR/AcrR family transcriptional regulator [Ferdinandcohnia quinoae]|uniref:TetR/AcrR family transcriptional regulator n=1 Tax=Fredinandcohnia quinoae TaxID=2918902 RepID=A0AAW5EB40_9BACI|nr:TetR/AcrR family transcriptional regulator [Fredinandcohnia sp. SECRCQ15]MCH1627177.1 TetR/AcrR family transcriptional regulator [Fredinandcohnia sp. SECRCQ15]